MIFVKIGQFEMSLADADEAWVNKAIGLRRSDGIEPCVAVRFDIPDVHLSLVTPSCARGGGGGRPPNAKEAEIIEYWGKMGLNSPRFNSSAVNQFLKFARSRA